MNNEKKVYLDSNGELYQVKQSSGNGISLGQMGMGVILAGALGVGGISLASSPSQEENSGANTTTQSTNDRMNPQNVLFFDQFNFNDCNCLDNLQEENTSQRDEETQQLLDHMAQTTDEFTLYQNGRDEALSTIRTLEIDRNKEGSQGERLKRNLEDVLSDKNGTIRIEGIDPMYQVNNGEISSPTQDFSNQIVNHYRNGEEENARIVYTPIFSSSDDQNNAQTSSYNVDGDSNKEENSQETGMVVFENPRSDSYELFVIKEDSNDTYTAKRMLYTRDGEIRASQNQEDTINNLTQEDIANLTYKVWSNPRVNELVQPTRDSVYFENQGLIENTSHDMLRNGVNSLEGRICRNEEQQNCISREEMANAFGVSAVYEHAAQESLEDISQTIDTPFYGHLKGDNSNVGSWVLSTVLPGDDWIAQNFTHYTGNVLSGDQHSQYRGVVEQCSQGNSSSQELFTCVDRGIKEIINQIPSYQRGGNE